MSSAPFDVQRPATEIEIAEAIRASDPDTADTIRRLAFERDKLRGRLISLASYAATGESENTEEWMLGLAEHLNKAAEDTNVPTVFKWHKSNVDGSMWFTTGRIP